MRNKIETMIVVCGLAVAVCTTVSLACDKDAANQCSAHRTVTKQVVEGKSSCSKSNQTQTAAAKRTCGTKTGTATTIQAASGNAACCPKTGKALTVQASAGATGCPSEQVMKQLAMAVTEMNKCCSADCAGRANVMNAMRTMTTAKPELACDYVKKLMASEPAGKGNWAIPAAAAGASQCGTKQAKTLAAAGASQCGTKQAKTLAAAGASQCGTKQAKTLAAAGASQCGTKQAKTLAAAGASQCGTKQAKTLAAAGASQCGSKQAKTLAAAGNKACDPAACAKALAAGNKACDPSQCSKQAKVLAAGATSCCGTCGRSGGAAQASFVAFNCEKSDRVARAAALAYLDMMREIKLSAGADGCAAKTASQVLASVINDMQAEQTASAGEAIGTVTEIEVVPVSFGAVSDKIDAVKKSACGAGRN